MWVVFKAPEFPLSLACLTMPTGSLATVVRDQWNVQPQLGRGKQAGLACWVFVLCDVYTGRFGGLRKHHTPQKSLSSGSQYLWVLLQSVA